MTDINVAPMYPSALERQTERTAYFTTLAGPFIQKSFADLFASPFRRDVNGFVVGALF